MKYKKLEAKNEAIHLSHHIHSPDGPSSKSNPFEGCAFQTNGICSGCFQSKVLPNGKGCSPKLPKKDTCAVYSFEVEKKERVSTCVVCKKGYALKQSSKPDQKSLKGEESTCIQGTIDYCIIEGVNPFNQHACNACSGGRYSVKDPKTTTSVCKRIANPIPHCRWGSFASRSKTFCMRCDPGYAVSKDKTRCEKWSQPGCWMNDGPTDCAACDPFKGYSIDSEGNCFKTDEVDTEKAMGGIIETFILHF